jgi:hypothetical protein
MIDGLKLTMTGEELRTRLDERVRVHERRAEGYKRDAKRGRGAQDSNFVLPEQICEFESERHQWRAEVLACIRDHIEGSEVYRLGEEDLEFGEILPEKPGCVEQDDFERENRVDFNLERLTKEVGSLASGGYAFAPRGFEANTPGESK